MVDFAQLEAARLDDEAGELILLDQTLLPGEVKFLRLKDQESIWQAIYKLQVRGAPAIGIAAGFALYLAAKQSPAKDFPGLQADDRKA